MQIRLAMSSMIYRKSLRLSKNAFGNISSGQVLNLMSNDMARFDWAIWGVHYLWMGPLKTLIVSYLMFYQIGWSAFVGVAFMLGFIPLQAYMGRKTSEMREKIAQKTDERIRLMNEIVQGIQVIKMYVWEKPFGKLIELARKYAYFFRK